MSPRADHIDQDEILLVLTNLPDQGCAERLAQALIAERAAACVNILAACTSLYHWQGKIQSATEIPLLIKTTRAAYTRLQELILTHHPYELPEIIAFPASAGLPAYLAWVANETQPERK